MARIVMLDSGPLGLASNARGRPNVDACRAWIRSLAANRARIVVPEIADYEVRRELLRVGATAGIRRLDQLEANLVYDPITTPAMHLAAELWAAVRRGGTPTAHPHALDGDCILAAQALLIQGPGDMVIIATSNVGHLSLFAGYRAELWTNIVP
jgi:predicted nucleic acid-binding protein